MRQSDLFRKSLAYADRLRPDAVLILSALHGVLDPDAEVEPYDLTLAGLGRAEKRAWGERVLAELGRRFDLENDRFVLLAGREYAGPLLGGLRHVEQPLEGMRVGERLGHLKAALS